MEEPTEYTVTYPITEEPLTLSIFWQFHNFLSMFGVTQEVIETIPTFQKAEEATGIKLDFRLVGEENFGNNLQLLWASGDYCDFITNAEREYTSGVDSAVEDGVLLDLVPYLDEHAPDYTRILNDHPDFRTELTSAEGHLVSFSEYCEYSDSGAVIRMDWLRQVGMEVPKTMDDVTEVARAFRDQLGVRNPVMWNADLATWFGWNAFGVANPDISDLGWQVLEDGKTVAPSLTLDGYKECLQWMHDAFAEGLVTDDFMNVMNIAFDEYVYANECGMCYTNSNLLADGGAERSGQPDYDLRAIPDPMKVAGTPNTLAKTTGGVGASALAISALTEYPVLRGHLPAHLPGGHPLLQHHRAEDRFLLHRGGDGVHRRVAHRPHRHQPLPGQDDRHGEPGVQPAMQRHRHRLLGAVPAVCHRRPSPQRVRRLCGGAGEDGPGPHD